MNNHQSYWAIIGNYAAKSTIYTDGGLLLITFLSGPRKRSPAVQLHWSQEEGADLSWTAPNVNASTTWLDELEAEVLGRCVRDYQRQTGQLLPQEHLEKVRKEAHRLQVEETGWFAGCLQQAAFIGGDERLLLHVRNRVQSGAAYVELPQIPASEQSIDRARAILRSLAVQAQG